MSLNRLDKTKIASTFSAVLFY